MTLGKELLYYIDETVNGHFETFVMCRVGFCGFDFEGFNSIFKYFLAREKKRNFENIVWVGF